MTYSHTRGHWTFRKPKFGNAENCFDVIGDNLIICEVRNHYYRPEAAEANARLIAAAPCLLVALENLMAVSDEKHPRWKEAQAALNKAKGL